MDKSTPADTMDNPRVYDIATEGWLEDLVFWEWLINEYRPRSILELACGTGRITLPLAAAACRFRADLRLVGLDVSTAALAVAREKQSALDAAVSDTLTFVEGDMRTFAFDERFDLILIGFNSFAHIHDTDDQLQCLRTIRQHLAPEGHFAFDVASPYCLWNRGDLLDAPPLRLMHDRPVPSLGIARFLQYAAHMYQPLTQTYRLHYSSEIFCTDGSQERILHEAKLHIYFPNELRMLLRLAGLAPIQEFGTYRREPFHPRSWQYIWVTAPVERALTWEEMKQTSHATAP